MALNVFRKNGLTPGLARRWWGLPAALVLIAMGPGSPPAQAQFGLLQAQTPPAAANGQANVPKDPMGRSTPRGTVMGFLRAMSSDDPERALDYLDTRLTGTRATALADQLNQLLNTGLKINLEDVSNSPDGKGSDGLPDDREMIGLVETRTSPLEVVLVRNSDKTGNKIWQFSPETLARVPSAYTALDHFSPGDYLPEPLREIRFLRIPLWRWLLMLLAIPLAFFAASGVRSLLQRVIPPLAARANLKISKDTDFRLTGPLRLLFIAVFEGYAATLSSTLIGRTFLGQIAFTLGVIAAAWMAYRVIDGTSEVWFRRTRSNADQSVIWLLRRATKAVVFTFAILALLRRADVDLTAVLTGLGIGGVAIAFAAQKTIENLFGGIMLITDSPFRVGDFCTIGDYSGTILDIGLRSTRMRTNDQLTVTIPNGTVAALAVVNFAGRSKYLFNPKIILDYSTTPDQMRSILSEIRRVMASNSSVEPDGWRVRFAALVENGLQIEFWSYISAPSYDLYMQVQEELYLTFMQIIADHGSSLATPTRSLMVKSVPDTWQQASMRGSGPAEPPQIQAP